MRSLPATARLFLLNVGTLLADHQVIHQPQDIFHFYYDELLEVLKKPVASHELIDNRKQEFEENRHKKRRLLMERLLKQEKILCWSGYSEKWGLQK